VPIRAQQPDAGRQGNPRSVDKIDSSETAVVTRAPAHLAGKG